jgi:hypothetical protein
MTDVTAIADALHILIFDVIELLMGGVCFHEDTDTIQSYIYQQQTFNDSMTHIKLWWNARISDMIKEWTKTRENKTEGSKE